ncbi:MAG: hypothetical protein FJ102_06630 [Deltaproteobacteria bacterium]|nr:hypothetical protein [Deltaproteobacteria bacterium]
MSTILFASLALAGSAKAPAAPACAADLQKALAEASPSGVGKAWVELANCDAATAKAAAPAALPRMIAGSGADAAALSAIKLGLGAELRAWVPSMQPDERSSFFNTLGEQCAVAEVPAFFAESEKALGDKFWSDRWYAALDACRDPRAVDVLKAGLSSQASERSRFKAILETLARNLGKDAIPMLQERAAAEKDSELSAYVVGAFADAAGVGSASGMNAAAAEAAIAAIIALAPTLPEAGLEQARTTLLALGSEQRSDEMAAHRYRSVAQADGSLQYAVYVSKVATCKKDSRVEVHTATVTGASRTWPDQLVARVKPTVDLFEWHLPKDCVGDVAITGSSAPLKDKAAVEAFYAAQDAEIQKKNPGLKAKVFPEEPIGL